MHQHHSPELHAILRGKLIGGDMITLSLRLFFGIICYCVCAESAIKLLPVWILTPDLSSPWPISY